jgi:hypothetical protein
LIRICDGLTETSVFLPKVGAGNNRAEAIMVMNAPLAEVPKSGYLTAYLESLALVERLHRLLLDVIKDEFERLGELEINSVQALLLFNIGDNEVTAGDLSIRIFVLQFPKRTLPIYVSRKATL